MGKGNCDTAKRVSRQFCVSLFKHKMLRVFWSVSVVLASLRYSDALNFVCTNDSRSVDFDVPVNEPIFFSTGNFPASEGGNWSCLFTSKPFDSEQHPMIFYYTHAALSYGFRDEKAYDGSGLFTCTDVRYHFDVLTSYETVFIQQPSCRVQNLTVQLEFSETRPRPWAGLLGMAFAANDPNDCPLSGGNYTFNESDPNRIYIITSSFLVDLPQEFLDQRTCTWRFDSAIRDKIKVVIPWMKLDRGETLNFTAANQAFTFNESEVVSNRVLYLSRPVDVSFWRQKRNTTPGVGFDAMFSAYAEAQAPVVTNITLNVTNEDEQHWPRGYLDVAHRDTAVIKVDPGYELQMSFDRFEVEECCDYLTLETALDGGSTLTQRLASGDFISVPPSTAQRTVTFTYDTDNSLEYGGFDLKFYGAKCNCSTVQQVLLTTEYANSDKNITIKSPSSADGRPYCSLLNCEYNVSIADDPALENCSILLKATGNLRPNASDDLTVVFGAAISHLLDGDVHMNTIIIPTRWTKIQFVSGANFITNCGSRSCPLYSWEISVSLLDENTGSTTSAPALGSTTADGGGCSTISLHFAVKFLLICELIRLLLRHNI